VSDHTNADEQAELYRRAQARKLIRSGRIHDDGTVTQIAPVPHGPDGTIVPDPEDFVVRVRARRVSPADEGDA
jgi:hypothetical protein